MNYDYSVYWENNQHHQKIWIAQMLRMPDEEMLRFRSFQTREEAQAKIREWKAKFGQ